MVIVEVVEAFERCCYLLENALRVPESRADTSPFT